MGLPPRSACLCVEWHGLIKGIKALYLFPWSDSSKIDLVHLGDYLASKATRFRLMQETVARNNFVKEPLAHRSSSEARGFVPAETLALRETTHAACVHIGWVATS